MEEIWFEIFPDYLISTLCNVDSLKGGARHRLKPWLCQNGYFYVTFKIGGVKKSFPVHQLVAKAFIPNPNNLPEVNHIDGNKLNNSLENLEWVTRGENNRHAWRTGLQKSGELHHQAKLSAEQIEYIRSNPDNLSGTELAQKFSVSKSTICNAQSGKSYQNVSGTLHEPKKHKAYTRLTTEQKTEIRRRHQAGDVTHLTLAKIFGVAESTISNIVNEK